MIKLIATDMDGTLLDQNGNLNEEFFNIMEELKKKNILFAAASGRQYYTLRENFSTAKDDLIYIAENGSFLVHNDEELYSSTLSREAVSEIVNTGRKIHGCKVVLCGKKAAYFEGGSEDLLREVQKYYVRHKLVDSFDDIDDQILKFTLYNSNGTSLSSGQILESAYGDRFQVAVSGQAWVDINNKNTNKGVAIRYLQEKFDIKPEETMAFGDYYNDIDMLDAAYYSYAMENAADGVKEHARFITGSNSENSVLEVIKREVLR